MRLIPSVSPPLNLIAARLSINTFCKPNCSNEGNFKAEIAGDLIKRGFSKIGRMLDSCSTFFLNAVNTSGISFIENGKSNA